MDDKYWKIIDEFRGDRGDAVSISLEDPDKWWRATAKWDGCIDIHRAFNAPFPVCEETNDVDSIHICDLKDFIARLQELVDIAESIFPEWDV